MDVDQKTLIWVHMFMICACNEENGFHVKSLWDWYCDVQLFVLIQPV